MSTWIMFAKGTPNRKRKLELSRRLLGRGCRTRTGIASRRGPGRRHKK